MEKELGYKPDIEDVKNKLKASLIQVFNFKVIG